MRNYYSSLCSNWDSQPLLHFAFKSAVIIIKILRLGVISFGLAPFYWASHLCFIMIFCCLLLGNNISFLFNKHLALKVQCWIVLKQGVTVLPSGIFRYKSCHWPNASAASQFPEIRQSSTIRGCNLGWLLKIVEEGSNWGVSFWLWNSLCFETWKIGWIWTTGCNSNSKATSPICLIMWKGPQNLWASFES